MTYTGEVEVGGPSATQTAGDLTITKIAVGPMANNAYLLRCNLTGAQALIDAADDAPRLLSEIGPAGLTHIITTHQHADHWQALAEVARETGAIVVAGEDDADVLPIDPDGIVHLFSGDSLFPGGVGRTWAPDDFIQLIDDIEQKIFKQFDDSTWFYPGHGNDSTLGAERPHISEWRARGW